MPLENLEDVLVKSHRKSHKKCCDASNKAGPCNPDCCVPDCNPESVVVLPVFEKVTPSETLVKVQFPEGKPLKITLPVATAHVG